MTAKAESAQLVPLSTAHEVKLLRELQALAAECGKARTRVASDLKRGLAQAERDLAEATESTKHWLADARNTSAADHERATADTHKRYEQDRDSAQHQYKNLRQNVEMEHAHYVESARAKHKRLTWEAQALYDAKRGQPPERFQETSKALQQSNRRAGNLGARRVDIMKMRRQWREFPPPARAVHGA